MSKHDGGRPMQALYSATRQEPPEQLETPETESDIDRGRRTVPRRKLPMTEDNEIPVEEPVSPEASQEAFRGRSTVRRRQPPLNENHAQPAVEPVSPEATQETSSKDASQEPPKAKRSRKRKRDVSTATFTRSKRMKKFYSKGYRKLFLETEHHNEPRPPRPQGFQTDTADWSAKERDVFFEALARHGKADVRSIAKKVGTKTQVEVQDYINALESAVKERHVQGGSIARLVRPAEIPAAVEVSKECCESLNKASRALALRHQRREETREHVERGEFWLLNEEAKNWVENTLKLDDGEARIHKEVPSASLLRLGNWLELSERVFMNSSIKEDNWQTIAEFDEFNDRPAIYASAFEDFYELAVNFTRRIIASTIFAAEARLRTANLDDNLVQAEDVDAALDVLKFAPDISQYWQKVPRRCKLQVHRNLLLKKPEKPLPYEAVEKSLARSPFHRSAVDESIGMELEEPSHDEDEISSDEDSNDASNADGAEKPKKELASRYQRDLEAEEEGLVELEDKALKDEEKYMGAIDAQASLEAELELWETLEQEPPFSIDSSKITIPKVPKAKRKDASEFDDWRVFARGLKVADDEVEVADNGRFKSSKYIQESDSGSDLESPSRLEDEDEDGEGTPERTGEEMSADEDMQSEDIQHDADLRSTEEEEDDE